MIMVNIDMQDFPIRIMQCDVIVVIIYILNESKYLKNEVRYGKDVKS